jgi:uncharacterized protein YjbI with pentapeptide repeats
MTDKQNQTNKVGRPRFINDEAYRQLRSGDIEGFHKSIVSQAEVDFTGSDLRGTDLRNADLSKVKIAGCYLRDADLRGKDLRQHELEGCSLFNARISGTWFPSAFSAEEIRLSIEHGTRLRRH